MQAWGLLFSQSHPSLHPSAGPKHHSLCIGISSYPAGCSLRNSIHDAEDMSSLLAKSGFQSTLLCDPSYEVLSEAVRSYASSLSAGDTSVVFISSHSAQEAGENYILPCDFGGQRSSLQHQAVAVMEGILLPLEKRGVALKVILLDVDGPHQYAEAPRGSIIGFSCSEGEVGLDGPRRNGFYTESLLRHLGTGMAISKVLETGTAEVLVVTEGRMKPWSSHQLSGEEGVILVPASAVE
jgi:hypothetical protein